MIDQPTLDETKTPDLVEFLLISGVDEKHLGSATDEMCLLHDLGIIGDNAWEAFEFLSEKIGVDLSSFVFSDYFPSEVSRTALILSSRLLRPTKLGRMLAARYQRIRVSDIRAAISARSWSQTYPTTRLQV